jgi:hypothetical protein
LSNSATRFAEWLFRILLAFPGTFPAMRRLILALTEEDSMKKFAYVIAALGVFAIVAPSIASAQDVVVGRDRIGISQDRDRAGARAEAREGRGEFRERREFRRHRAEFRERREFRRHRHGDRVVVIKRREY